MIRRTLLFLVVVVVFQGAVSAQFVHFVDSAATGLDDGSSWTDAFVDLQDALAASTTGDEIWVAAGTYLPGVSGDLSATFQLVDGVSVYGGFAGGEATLAQRDVGSNLTVLSADLDGDDTYGSGLNWWQFNWNGSPGNSFHIVTGTGVGAQAALDGFTILAGKPDDPAFRGGGGLLVDGGSPSIRNCTFQYHATGFGSSAALVDCNSTFENCVIKDGYTCNCGSGGWVSGILVQGTSNVTFLDCDFLNHYYVSSQGQGRGAALRLEHGCFGTLERCRFIGNQTGNFYPIGGGTASGAGISAADALFVDRCQFIDNFAHAGAGIACGGDATILNSLFVRNEAVSHPENSSLSVGDYGAGIAAGGFSASSMVTVENCTFVDNVSDKGGAMAFYGAGTATVRNCIAFHNRAHPQTPGEDPIYILKQQIVGSFTLENCCVEGLFGTEDGEDPPEAANFPGCFDVDPGIVSISNFDYTLLPSSPCINTGLGGTHPGAGFDLSGATAVGSAVDVGCHEFTGVPVPSIIGTNLVETGPNVYTVVNALPGEQVFLIFGLFGTGAGPCVPPPSMLCLDLVGPLFILGTPIAGLDGHAIQPIPLPVGAPLVDVWTQAIVFRGPGLIDTVKTSVLHRKIQQQP